MKKIIDINYVKEQFATHEYEVLTDIYINAKTKFEAKCDKGHTITTTWDNFKQGSRCKICRTEEARVRVSKTHAQFKAEVLEWSFGEYELLTEYEHNAKNVTFLHKECGNIFKMRPNTFKQGARCPKCSSKIGADAQRKTQEQYELEVKDIVDNEFTVLSKYKNNKTKILFRHNVCGHEFRRTAVKFITETHSCPSCGDIKYDRTTQSLKEEISKITNEEYSLLSDYKGMRDKVRIAHNSCGHEWRIAPDTFINGGVRCPRCSSSKAEIVIQKYLIDNNIEFKPQYRIYNCRNIRPLPFDFAIFKNNVLVGLIEYDGEQHYKPWYKMGKEKAEKQLIQTQLNDNIKNEYCKRNNIRLLRIPYWHNYKIEKILETEIYGIK